MTYTGKIIAPLVFLVSVAATESYGEDKHHHETHQVLSGVESLSPELRALLATEMQEIQKGMISLVPAYASGNWTEIEEIGTKIQRSYILKQNITDAQITELHNSLPGSFIELDQQFHYFAGMLSHAANKKKPELVGFYISKLSESCVNCHARYATHKFNGFIEQGKAENH